MNDIQLYVMPIEELAARTIMACKALAEDLPVNLLSADAHQHRHIRGLLNDISGDDPAGPRALQSVDLLADILRAEHETETMGYEDVFTKIDMCRAHYDMIGLGSDYVDQFIR